MSAIAFIDAGELEELHELPPHRKELSQWFTPPAVATHVLDVAGLLEGDRATVLEPAAGAGALVLPAIARGHRVRAVEIDPAWAAVLERRARRAGDLTTVVRGDFLELPPAAELADVAILNPPYEGGADVRFVRKAMSEARSVVALVRAQFLSLVSAAELLEAPGWHLSHLVHFRGRPRFKGPPKKVAKGKRPSFGPRSDFAIVRLDRGVADLSLVEWRWPR